MKTARYEDAEAETFSIIILGQDFQLCGHLFFAELMLENYCELCINYHLLISVDLNL
jgi:hypothetical protein